MTKEKIQLYRFLFSACFLLTSFEIDAQSVSTAVSRNNILIGERIEHSIQFKFPQPDFKVQFNTPDSIPHFHIIDKKSFDTTDRQGNFLVVQKLLLTSFDSGKWSIPAMPVKLHRGPAVYDYNSDPVLIDVGYAKEDTTGLYDIKPPIKVALLKQTDWLLIGAILLTLLIVGILLYNYIKNRRKRPKQLFHSSQTAYQEAMAALEDLQKATIETPQQVREFHTALSEIFRKYNSRKQQANLMSLTTTEMLLNLQQKAVGTDVVSQAAEVLGYNDAVKFAKYQPPKFENDNALQKMKKLVTELQQFYQPKNNAAQKN